MADRYFGFVDWMKAIGLFLIVYGHVAIGSVNFWVPPVYPKQFGVACFIFVLGFVLARETRAVWPVVFSRLFPIVLYGLAGAVLVSVVRVLTIGDINESNYLPLLGGANVLFNDFPANPTTWYIGTYMHVLLLWALAVSRVSVGVVLLVVALAVEAMLRAWLSAHAGLYVAYMLWTNWTFVFLVGRWFGQQPSSVARGAWWAWMGALVAGLLVWHRVWVPLVADRTFPFMRLMPGDATSALAWLPTATAVSVLYAGVAWLVFRVTSLVEPPRLVRFVSRNTIVVFILHMPVFYVLSALLAPFHLPYLVRAPINLLVTFVGLLLVSEAVNRMVRPDDLRRRAFVVIERRLGHARSGAPS